MKKIIALLSLVAVLAFSLTGCMTLRNLPIGGGSALVNGDKYTAGDRTITDKVDRINIDWVSGSVTVKTHTEDSIEIRETLSDNSISDDERVQSWVDGTTLRIAYQRRNSVRLFNNPVKKELLVLVPESMTYQYLDAGVASAEMTVTGVTAEELSIGSASGNVIVSNVEAENTEIGTASGGVTMSEVTSDTLKVSTASGTVDFSGDAKDADISIASGEVFFTAAGPMDSLRVHTTSGEQTFSFSDVPKKAEFSSASGNIKFHVPEDAGFTAKISTASGKVSYDLPMTREHSKYVAGSGAAEFEISTASGDVDFLTN